MNENIRVSLRLSFAGSAAAFVLLLSTWQAEAALPQYTIQTLGLTDAEHTSFDGQRESTASVASARYAAGTSMRYFDGHEFGAAAWVLDLATGTFARAGFVDAEHTGQL